MIYGTGDDGCEICNGIDDDQMVDAICISRRTRSQTRARSYVYVVFVYAAVGMEYLGRILLTIRQTISER